MSSEKTPIPEEKFPLQTINIVVIVVLIAIVGWLVVDRSQSMDEEDIIATVRAEIVEGDTGLAMTAQADNMLMEQTRQADNTALELTRQADISTVQANIAQGDISIEETRQAADATQIAVIIANMQMGDQNAVATNQAEIIQAATDQNIDGILAEALATHGDTILTEIALAYPSETPTPTNTATHTPSPTATATATFTATNTATPSPTHTATNTPEPTATVDLTHLNQLTMDSHTVRKLSDLGGGFVVGFSYDNEKIAYANFDDDIVILSALTGNQLSTLEGLVDTVWALAWSPTESLIAAGANNGEIMIWDADSGNLRFQFTIDDLSNIQDLAWSADGNFLAVISYQTLGIYDMRNGRQIVAEDPGNRLGYTVNWSPDGTQLVYMTSNEMVWAEFNGLGITVIERIDLERDTSFFNRKARWSPDGKFVATTHADRIISIWDANTRQKVQQLIGIRANITDIDWSPNSQYLVGAGEDEIVHIWVVETGLRIYELELDYEANALSWSPNGQKIAMNTLDTVVWNVPELKAGE